MASSCKTSIGALAFCAVAVLGPDTARAGTITKAGTGTELNAGASWVGGTTPTPVDVAAWTGTSLGSGLTLGANTNWLGLHVLGALTDIDISGAGTLTLGSSGIDLSSSTVHLSIANPIALGAGQSWKVSTGKSLTSSGVISGGFGLTHGVFVTSATYAAAFLPASPDAALVFAGTSLASVTSVAGWLGGLAIPTPTGQAASVHYFTNDGTTATFQMQIPDSGLVKGIKIQLTQSGADIYGTVLYAKYVNPGSLGVDLDATDNPAIHDGLVATSPSVYSYGCPSVTITMGIAAAGTFNFSGANTYTGATTVNAGTVKAGVASVINVSGAFGNNSAVVMANAPGAVLDINGYPTQLGSLTGGGAAGGNVINSSVTAASLTVGGDNTSPAAYSGIIGANLSLTKTGSGTLTLSGANTFTGGTLVNRGTLVLDAGSPTINRKVLAAQSDLTVSNSTVSLRNIQAMRFVGGGTLTVGAGGLVSADVSTGDAGNYDNQFYVQNLVLQGGTLAATYPGNNDYGNFALFNGGSVTTSGAGGSPSTISALFSIIMANTTFTVAGDSPLLVSGAICQPSGPACGLTKAGAGLMTLSAANTYSGATIVSAGTFSGDGSIGGPTTVQSGGTLAPGTTSIGALTINNTLTIGTGGTNLMRIDKQAGPVLSSDLITGLTEVTYGGTLKVTATGAPLAVGDSFTLFSAGAYYGLFDSYDLPVLPAGMSWDKSGLTIDGSIKVSAIASTPVFTPPAGGYQSPQSVTIGADPGARIFYTTDGSTPTPASPSSTNSVVLALPANTATYTLSAYATNTAQVDSGVAVATYSTTPVPTWIETAGGFWSTGASWSNNVVANGSSVTANFSALTLPGDLYVTLDGSRTVGMMLFGDMGSTYNSSVFEGVGTLTLDAGVTSPTITVGNMAAAIGAPMAGTHGLTKDGVGTLTLSAANTFTGGTVVNRGTLVLDAGSPTINRKVLAAQSDLTVSNSTVSLRNVSAIRSVGGGTLKVGAGGLVSADVSTGTPDGYDNQFWLWNLVMQGGTLAATYPGNNTYGNFAIYNGGSVTASGAGGSLSTISAMLCVHRTTTFTVAGDSPLLVSGNIASENGPYGLIKTGSGTLTLSGTNTYSGATTISNGTLVISGSLAAQSAVLIALAGTLGGNGTINGLMTVEGTVSPGASVGTLTTSNQTWNAGGIYLFQLDSATNSGGWDYLNINGTLDIQATSASKFVIKLGSMADATTPGLVPGFNGSSNYSWTVATASGGILNFDASKFSVDSSAFSNPHPGNFSVGTNGNSLVVNYVVGGTPVPPVLTGGASLGHGQFNLTFSGPSGQTYKVLMSTNVALPITSWTHLTDGTFGASAVAYTDTGATNAHRFYRIVSP